MKPIWQLFFFTTVVVVSHAALCAEPESELNLDETSDLVVNHYFPSGNPARRTGYGSGGYGDPANTDFSLNVCASGQAEGANCTSNEPGTEYNQWRYLKGIGWRKFNSYGAQQKDWWDYKHTLGWPFNQYQKRGYNWQWWN